MNNKHFYYRSVDRIAKRYDELKNGGDLFAWCQHVSMLYGVPTVDVLGDAKIFSLKWLGE